MKIGKKKIELQDGLEKEWILSNGMGGFCSTTILGANTRRYHGLLIASLIPPAQRHLILSKVDENITIGDENFGLYTNLSPNYVSEGYKYLESFEKDVLPVYTFKVKDVKIVKTISMIYGRNTVVIQYKVKNGKSAAKLTLAPLVNFRDFHQMTTNHNFYLKQVISKDKVRIEIDGNANAPIYIHCSEGNYIMHENDEFRNMFYAREEERGFYAEEDHAIPGRYEIDIKARQTKEITFVCSLEDNTEQIDSNRVFEDEINRVNRVADDTGLLISKSRYTKVEKEYNEVMRDLLIASETFIINRPTFGTHSVVAGYPWFLDWGRDTLIAFEGLFLVTRRYNLAKEILLTFTRDIKFGLVPNGYSGFDNRPLYNSADASLLLFEEVNKYIQYTKDYDFIKDSIYDKLVDIINNYRHGIDLDNNNIYVDEDGLLVSGTPETQNTWMDAKIGNYAVTPRNGKVVELNSLWYNALKTMEFLARRFKDPAEEEYAIMAEKHKKVFEKNFYNSKKKCLYDVLGDDKVRPNQLFAISTTYPVIKPSSEVGKAIMKTVKTKLLTKYGVRTLAKDEEGYKPFYRGNPYERDTSYHQGVAWVWILGLYYNALKNVIDDEKDRLDKEKYLIEEEKFLKTTFNTFKAELEKDGIGTISELYDAEPPFKTGGTFSQAWSVSEVIKIISKYQ